MARKIGKKTFPKRGEIYWIDFDPARGDETRKRRPGLIVSNNVGNELSGVIQVAPVTSKVRNVYPFEVETEVAGKPAKIMLNQCRAIDKSRVGEKIAELDHHEMREVENALRIVFALN